jgi:hypothetical protein
VRIGVYGVGLSHTETTQDRRSNGAGLGGSLTVRLGRFGLDISGHGARLDSSGAESQSFDLVQGDVRASVRLATGVALEVGAGRRMVDPEFAAPDVGLGRVGLLSEIPVSSAGAFWGRAAYLVAPRFNGGGDAGLAFELGFGAGFGTRNGRVRGRVDYEFQRIDRTVNARDVPIQLSFVRLGIELGF